MLQVNVIIQTCDIAVINFFAIISSIGALGVCVCAVVIFMQLIKGVHISLR